MADDVKISPLLLGLAPLIAVTGYWLSKTNSVVPESYLDEVFHVGQAQRYCEGKWLEWDSKITTPPGLYLVAQLTRPWRCSIQSLRAVNTIACSILLPTLCILILNRISSQNRHKPKPQRKQRGTIPRSVVHEGINTALFPPLFFFSGLFYTDPWSVLVVLACYYVFLGIGPSANPKALTLGRAQLTALGLISLLFRQTNVFWVAIFFAGLDVVRWLKSMNSSLVGPHSLTGIVTEGWENNLVYDPSVEEANFESYFFVALSIAIAGLRNLTRLIPVFLPYLSILASFAVFVYWNGGVVLGDKANHIATIHFAQMLYVWPYMLFFSFPIVFGSMWTRISKFLPSSTTFKPSTALHTMLVLVGTTIAMAVVVHYNTLVHPFTLADNRHYMFYVFRYFIIGPRGQVIRYLLAPVYAVCAWIIIGALSSAEFKSSNNGEDKRHKSSTTDSLNSRSRRSGEPASFVLIWLLSTALSLVTAPLVEPRYFILPWIFWRLHLPQSKTKLQRSVETALLLAVNAITGYIFLYWPFKWTSEPLNQQRFMW